MYRTCFLLDWYTIPNILLKATSINAQQAGEAVRPDGAADETMVMHVGSASLQRGHKSYHSGAGIRRRWAVFATNVHILEVTNPFRQLYHR